MRKLPSVEQARALAESLREPYGQGECFGHWYVGSVSSLKSMGVRTPVLDFVEKKGSEP